MSAHDPSKKAVLGAAVALVALWAVSWGLSYVHLGSWSMLIALSIAAVKASLVVIVFMELLHLRPSVRIAAVSAIALFSLLMSLVVLDVVARGFVAR